MKLKNLMEEVVFNCMEESLKERDMCKCERCKMDIAGIALNKLPPKYVVTEKGEAYAKTDILGVQKNIDILTIVNQAISLVKDKPSHS